jgi:hypothetical protein
MVWLTSGVKWYNKEVVMSLAMTKQVKNVVEDVFGKQRQTAREGARRFKVQKSVGGRIADFVVVNSYKSELGINMYVENKFQSYIGMRDQTRDLVETF